ncbi:MAG TPA: tetratricopeptide repeat protein [Gaiellaceae bacterium]|nr:tetratricopeptide repeat protein [Gaiellaceae bacterium]
MPRRPSTHVDDPVQVGRRLRDARSAAGLSQRQLAFPGCTAVYISRIESGDRIPSLQVLRELGGRLGVSADWLATGAEPPGLAGDPLVEAEVALRFAEQEHARAIFERLLIEETDDHRRARALAGLGQAAFAAGEHLDSIELFEQALALSPALEDADPAVADSLGRAYAMTSQYASAIGVFQRRLEAAQRRKDAMQTVRFAVLLANALTDRGAFSRAERVLAHALGLARDMDDPLVRARLWWSQSRLHALQNDVENAERYARYALDTLALTEHARYAGLAHQVLAHIKLDRGEAGEALDLLERGLPLVREGGNSYEEGLFAVERGRALAQLGLLEEARELAAAGAAALASGSPVDAGRAHMLLGEIHERLDEPEEAADAYRLALAVLPVTDRYKLEAYARLAKLLRNQGRVDEALELLDAALRLRTESPV